MTHDEYNDLSTIIGKLESLSSTFEMVRLYTEPYKNEWDGVFYVACYSMEAVLSELNENLTAIYKKHERGTKA